MLIAPNADRFDPVDPAIHDLWMGFADWETPYFPKYVGLRMEDIRRDYCRMRLPWRVPELIQPQGLMHGGAIATLIDTVVVPAIASVHTERHRLSTISMAINYTGAVVESDIIGEGWVTKRGRSVVFCQVEVFNEDADQVAFGTVVYKVGSPVKEFKDAPIG